MDPLREKDSAPDGRFSTFIRDHRAEILSVWEGIVRQLPIARDLDRPALIDHLPNLLDRIATIADELVAGEHPRLAPDLAEVHALERLDAGFDLGQVVAEYAVLRDCVVRMWSRHSEVRADEAMGVRALNQAIDKAVGVSVQRYTHARERTLLSLDRISAAALETHNLDEFLDRLLHVLMETTAAVDAATILLRDGDTLRARASVGAAIPVGDGMAESIAESRKPHLTRADGAAVFGIPLVNGGEVIGVATMASTTATDFSRQDRLLFSAMGYRATSAIFQHLLRDAAEAKARQQLAVATLGMHALDTRDPEALVEEAVRVVRTTLGAEDVAVLEVGRERSVGYELCVEILIPGAPPYGQLCARLPKRDGPSTDGAAFLQAIARVLGIAIALRRSEQERDAVIDAIPDALFVGDERGLRRCNAAALELLGCDSAAELQQLSREEVNRRLRSRDLETGALIPAGESPFARALAGHTSLRHVAVTNPRTGRAVVLRSSAAPIYRDHEVIGAVSVNVDLTEQRRVQDAAERSYAVLDSILTASALGIAFVDTELRYVRINEALAEIDGVPVAEHLGRTVMEVLGERTERVILPLLRRVLETREPAMNVEVDLASPSAPDHVRSFLANYVPVVTPHGELLGIGAVVIEITDRKRMETALREREEHFRTLADNIPQLAWMADAAGDVFWFNRRWTDFAGAAPDPSVFAAFRQHVASGEMWEETVPLRAKDGRSYWFLSRAVPVRDEGGRVVRWFGTNTDVTEQRFLVDASMVLSSSRDYVATLAKIEQMAVPAIADRCRVELDDEPRVRGSWIADDRRSMTVPMVARDRMLGTIAFAHVESGRTFEAHDLELGAKLGRYAGLAVDNVRLLEEAQRASRMREELLAIVSHDLKNPLGVIQLAAALVLQNAAPPTRKHLETIERAVSRMDHLIGDLLDVGSIQAGRLAIEKRAEDAESLVREAVEQHEPLAKEKRIRLVRASGVHDVSVCCDRQRILQVFGNLVGNAIKFCRDGDTIAIRCERDGADVVFSVSDTGPGIAASELAHIFDPYWSAKQHAKKGTGLGLFISKGIVEAHGGRLSAESAPGAGATFYFALPIT